jgi:hypothetical protein
MLMLNLSLVFFVIRNCIARIFSSFMDDSLKSTWDVVVTTPVTLWHSSIALDLCIDKHLPAARKIGSIQAL